ncbi:hypothetical protein [Nostoc sp.]|uniref:hypothetical protein n=1 Tax=Nostoc sp. TaxID=1180 RepID=UPI002FF6551D
MTKTVIKFCDGDLAPSRASAVRVASPYGENGFPVALYWHQNIGFRQSASTALAMNERYFASDKKPQNLQIV